MISSPWSVCLNPGKGEGYVCHGGGGGDMKEKTLRGYPDQRLKVGDPMKDLFILLLLRKWEAEKQITEPLDENNINEWKSKHSMLLSCPEPEGHVCFSSSYVAQSNRQIPNLVSMWSHCWNYEISVLRNLGTFRKRQVCNILGSCNINRILFCSTNKIWLGTTSYSGLNFMQITWHAR